MGALHALIQKNVVEKVQNQTSLAFSNRLFLVPKSNNKWKPILYLSSVNKYLKLEKFQMETPEKYNDFLAERRIGNIHRFQGHLLPCPNRHTVQEVPAFTCPGSMLPIQSSTIWSVHCCNVIHNSSQGSQTDGSKQRYENPPVPRRLVSQSHISPNLPPLYSDPSSSVSTIRLDSKYGEVTDFMSEPEIKADFQIHRLSE